VFANRSEAGQKLAQELLEYKNENPIIMAIPRGGIVVADQVAQFLECPLDIIITRKIGAPGNPELAMGAVSGPDKVIINEDIKYGLRVSDDYIEKEVANQLEEIKRRRSMYLGQKLPLDLKGKPVIIIDDGLATGYTAIAAIDAIKEEHPSKIVLAVPVASSDTCQFISSKVDKIVCLMKPEIFYAVGQFYMDFSQTTDDEVIEIMRKYH